MRNVRQRLTNGDQTQPHDERGFTILETAIAMVVMMVAALGAASLFAYSIGNNANAKDRDLAMSVAQQQLEQLRNVAFTDETLTATDTKGSTAEITNAGRRYGVVTTIADSNIVGGRPTLKTIRIRVVPAGSSLGVTLVTRRATTTIGPNR